MGPSSARNDRSHRIVFSKTNNSMLNFGNGRLQPNQTLINNNKRLKKKNASSTSCKKRSPQVRKTRIVK